MAPYGVLPGFIGVCVIAFRLMEGIGVLYVMAYIKNAGKPKEKASNTPHRLGALLLPVRQFIMVEKDREDLVFASQRGDVFRVSNYRKRFFTAAVEKRQAADKTFPTITPHDLRHTAANLAVSAGANVKAVQRMLGHAKASMTLNVYADLFDDDLDSVAVRLDAAIKSAADSLRTKSTQ
jgi:integrase